MTRLWPALLLGGCVAAPAPTPLPVAPPRSVAVAPAQPPLQDIRLDGRLEQGGIAYGNVPPGTTLNEADRGYAPPALVEAALRRR